MRRPAAPRPSPRTGVTTSRCRWARPASRAFKSTAFSASGISTATARFPAFSIPWRATRATSAWSSWLASNFELNAEDFDLKKDDLDRWRAYVPRLGMYFIHDFKFSTEDKEQCRIELKQKAPNALRKYRYLGDKFINILRGDHRILLVLADSAADFGRHRRRPRARDSQREQGRVDFSILQVAFSDVGVKTVDHPDVIGVSMDNSAAKDWTGVHAGYDEAFSNISFRPSPDAGKSTSRLSRRRSFGGGLGIAEALVQFVDQFSGRFRDHRAGRENG